MKAGELADEADAMERLRKSMISQVAVHTTHTHTHACAHARCDLRTEPKAQSQALRAKGCTSA